MRKWAKIKIGTWRPSKAPNIISLLLFLHYSGWLLVGFGRFMFDNLYTKKQVIYSSQVKNIESFLLFLEKKIILDVRLGSDNAYENTSVKKS